MTLDTFRSRPDALAEPVIRDMFDLFGSDGYIREDWIEITCPFCKWHSGEYVLKRSIDPFHLFRCKRARFGPPCLRQWSIVFDPKVEA